MQGFHVTAERLRRLTSAILRTGGSAGSEADLVADHLVEATSRGTTATGSG
jgi:LDH2 family malate/lactate/ureidoglycolate dehydrogenase